MKSMVPASALTSEKGELNLEPSIVGGHFAAPFEKESA